jgi:hypothetical protein
MPSGMLIDKRELVKELHVKMQSVVREFVNRTPGISSMRALGIRSSYKGRTVDA